MARLTSNKKLVSVVACGLIASAFAPAAAPAYYATGSGSESNTGSESSAANTGSAPTPDVVLSRSDNPSASSAVTSGPTPDVLLSRSENSPATSNALTSGPTPDVLLSRTDNPLSTPEVAAVSDDSSGLDWGSAGIGAAIAVGLIVLSLAGLLGIREVRRSPAGP